MKVAIVGPTGVGKTKLSIKLAKYLNANVINFDSVQIYKGLDIGSSKVTEEEKEGVKHLLLDIKNPDENYSVKEYQDDVRKVFEDYKDKNLVMVGGTGLYVCAALMDYRFSEDEKSVDYSKYSDEELYELVLKKDKNSKVDKNNRRRLERFLNRKNEEPVDPVLLYDDVLIIGLTTSREKLYDLINKRVDKMVNEGLVEEVKALKDNYPNSEILKRAIGYKEIISFLNGEISLEEAKELIKKNSRHYAKRQYTWFNNKMDVKWFDVTENFDEGFLEIREYVNSCNK